MMILPLSLLFAWVQFSNALTQWYPLASESDERKLLIPFQFGASMPLDCMVRNIDNGEHKQDEKGNIEYSSFPICKETSKPLALHYGIDEDLSCTIALTDQLFHLLQLYIHEDAPFSCRLPITDERDVSKRVSVPLALNLRGTLSDSHIHVDNNLNLMVVKPKNFNSIISSTAFSSGTNVTRVIIGDHLKLNFAVRWLDIDVEASDLEKQLTEKYHYNGGFYKLPLKIGKRKGTFTEIGFLMLMTALITGGVTYAITHVKLKRRNQLNTAFEFDKRD